MRRAISKPTAPADFPRLISDFRAEGYEGLQLKISQYGQYLDDPEGRLREWGDDPGIYSALIAFDTLDDDGLSRLYATIDFAVATGSERIVFCHNHDRVGVTPEVLRGYARLISDAGLRARERGVAMSLHHHFDQPVMLQPDFEAFFDEVEEGAVGLTVDTAHLAKSGFDDLPGFIRTFASVIDNIHLKDYDGQWRLLGQGELDLAGVVTALQDVGYTGWLCVDEESTASLEDGFRVSKAWLDAHL